MKVSIQRIVFYNFVIMLLFFTVVSPQLINPYLENNSLNNSTITTNSVNHRLPGIRNSIINGLAGGTAYTPGTTVEIGGFLDYMQQYYITIDPSFATNKYQFVPAQSNISIYIQNKNVPAYKLNIVGGSHQTTTGVDTNSPYGVDDNLYTTYGLTYLTTTIPAQNTEISTINSTGSVGYFDIIAKLPNSTSLASLGIPYGSVNLYVVFGGNSTSSPYSPLLPSWTIHTFTITISNTANLQASIPPSYNIIVPNAPRNSSTFTVNLTDGSSGKPISNKSLTYKVYNNNTDPSHLSPICSGTTTISTSNCTTSNINFTYSTPVTTSTGGISFTVSFISWNSVNTIYHYAFKIYADYTGSNLYANSPFVVENFTFERQQGNLQLLSKNPNTIIFRPSENVNITVQSYLNATGLPFANVPINTPQLYYRNNNTAFLNGTNGFTVISGTGTNTSGLLTLTLKTTTATATGTYGLKIQANYNSFTGSPNYIVNNLVSSTVWYNFSIDNMYDTFALIFYSAVPYNTTTITPQPAPGNITQIVFKASILYNTSWLSYHTGYPTSAPAVGIPINATLQTPGSNLTLSIANIIVNPLNTTGYYYTNSTGYIIFNITATYPLTYIQILEKLIIKANLPGISTDKFIRYYNTGTHSYTTTPSFTLPTTGSFSVDPGYVPINVILDSPANNLTSTTFIRPGDWITLNFKAIYTNNLTAVAGVPISFSISFTTVTGLLLTAINGTTLTASSYLLTNASGEVSIILRSTYGVTIESTASIIINIIATANITLFNQLKNKNQPPTYSRPYYTGMYHQGTDTFTHYSNTWSNITNSVTLKAGYTFGIPSWQNTIKVRPGTNTTIVMTVKNNVTNIALTGIKFPVNITAVCYNVNTGLPYASCSSVGVSLSISDTVYNPKFNTSYYYTNSSSGQLRINVLTSLRFYPNPLPKYINITLNATIDFKDKLSSTLSTSILRWYIGTMKVGSDNLSQNSLSINNNLYPIGRVNQDPQYKFATMVAVLPSLNQVVQPLNIITIKFRISIINDTGATEYLNNVFVSLNPTLLNMFGMTTNPSQNTTYTNSNGYATFNLTATQNTPDGSYYMQATANLGANKTLIGSSINGYWINGTLTGGINNTYDVASTVNFTVLRATTITVTIQDVRTPGGALFSTGAPFQAYRGYTLDLQIAYKDQFNNPIQNKQVVIYYNTSSNILNINKTVLATPTQPTDSNGLLSVSVVLPANSNIIVGPSIIWANDTTNPSPKPVLNGAQLKVITNANFTVSQINTYGKTFLTTGDQVTVSGFLKDDLGQTISTGSLYPSSVLGELTNNLLIYGSATNNASAIGISTTTPSFTTGTFTINFTLPSGYAQQTLPIYIDLKNDTSAIPDFVHTPVSVVSVNTYQYLHPLELQLSGSGISFTNFSNSANYHIDNNTNGYSLTITVFDQFNRPVSNFTFTAIANITQILSPLITNNNGQLSRVASLSEYTNTTLTPRIISLQYKNGTVINTWSLTITRTVYDRTAPIITVVQPVSPNNTAIYQNTFINITLSDGNPTTTVATGINPISYTITIKDNNNNILSPGSILLSPNCALSSNGYTYICTATLNYAVLSTGNTSITMTIFVRDNGIESSTLNYVLTFDRDAPQFNLASLTPANKTYIAAHTILSLVVTDNDRNGVSVVSAHVTIGGVTTIYQLTQINPATHIWSSQSIDFSSMTVLDKNATVIFIASDPAGNTNTMTILYVADIIKPSITIDNYNVLENSIQFVPFSITARVSDAQSGINASSLVLTHGQVSSLINQSITSINGVYSYIYTIRVTPNINGLTNNQAFSIGISDNAGNSNTTSMIIRTDINPPVLQSIQITDKNNNNLYPEYFQPSASTNTSFTDTGVVLNSDHKLIFSYTDPNVAGISSGINSSGTSVTLWVFNKTSGNYQEIVNLNDIGLNVQVIVGTNNITVFWHTSSNDTKLIGLSGQGGTGPFNIGLQWSINLKDNAGHTVLIQYDYTYQVYVPTILDFIFSTLTTAILAIAIFGVAGIIIAVVYERIRFEK